MIRFSCVSLFVATFLLPALVIQAPAEAQQRVRKVTPTTAKVGKIVAIFADGRVIKTSAALVGPDLVGAAAHSIFRVNKIGQMAKRIHFAPFGGDERTVLDNYATDVFVEKSAPNMVWPEFMYSGIEERDFAFIRMKHPPALTLDMTDRWFEIRASNDPPTERFVGDVFGFPGDFGFPGLWHVRCAVSPHEKKRQFVSRCPLRPGQSGSALLESHGSGYRVRGIASSVSRGRSYFVAISPEVHADWLKILGDREPSLGALTRVRLERPDATPRVLLMADTDCHEHIQLALRVFDPEREDWISKGWLLVQPGGSTPVWAVAPDKEFYYHARSPGGTRRWGDRAPERFFVEGDVKAFLSMTKVRLDARAAVHRIRLNCGR
jgi:hypothetical protein